MKSFDKIYFIGKLMNFFVNPASKLVLILRFALKLIPV